MDKEKKNFIINASKLKETADKLQQSANEIDNIIYDIYYTINSMNEYWQGISYQSFLEQTQRYKKNLEFIIDLIIVFKRRIELLSSESNDLIKNVKRKLDFLLLEINAKR